jgi:hypothetical protein
MPGFGEFFDQLKKDILHLVKSDWGQYAKAAHEDAETFLTRSRVDLERWTKELASGDLSRDDFEFLIQSKKDLAELAALKNAGLALVQLDRFRSSLLQTVIGTAFRVFVP